MGNGPAAIIHELRVPIYVRTPKGDGLAYAWIWEHQDRDMLWMVCIESTQQFWTFRNPEIRLCWNYTMGIGRRERFPSKMDADKPAET